MIDLYTKTIIFFIISFIYFFSIVGYGKVIVNKNSNYFEAYLDGTILLLIISYLIYITSGTNQILNIIILSVGLILYFKFYKELKSIKYKYIFYLLLSIFSVLIISKTHEDFNGYHYFSIFEIYNHNLRIGVSNLNDRFFHSSLLALNQSTIVLPYFDFKLVHLPSFFIYFSVIGYFIVILFSNEKKNKEVFYSLLCFLILLVKFNRLSEYGYDYISQFILLIVFHKIYFLSENNKEIIKSIIYFLLCVLIKPTSLLFSPIMIFVIYKKGISFYRFIPISKYFLIFSISIVIFSSSFFKTGCFFYPINKTCFSIENISWSEKDRIKNHSKEISLWAKTYHAQDKTKYEKIEDKKLFNQGFKWMKYWIEVHFFYKIFEFLLIITGLIILINIYFKNENKPLFENKKDRIILCFLSLSSIIFWLYTIPQFRFGFSSIIIFFYLFFDLLFDLNIKFNTRKFFHVFIFGLMILNIKNIDRIQSEFERNDFYKFKNFPFYNEKSIKNDYSQIKIEKFLNIEILK
jgi:hypothetical protein